MPATAHVTLENLEAKVGTSYKAVLRVPHGCDGTATTVIRVKIPEGVIGVKPMPKPGWTLTTVTGKYPKAYDLFHRQITEGVTEISWSGGKLPDDWYDEFVFQGFLAETSTPASRSTSRWCRNARRACTAGSKFPPPENHRPIILNPRQP